MIWIGTTVTVLLVGVVIYDLTQRQHAILRTFPIVGLIKHDTFPLRTYHPGDPEFDPQFRIPCAKVMGGARGRARAFRPTSVINVSGMSVGSLDASARRPGWTTSRSCVSRRTISPISGPVEWAIATSNSESRR